MLKVQIMKNATSILRQRRILEHLLRFANEGNLAVITGIIPDLDGRPLVYISPILAQAIRTIPDVHLERLFKWIRMLFAEMDTDPDNTIVKLGIAVNNAGLEMSMNFSYDGEGPGYFVPDPKTPFAFILALLMVCITANDNGHPLLARVVRCRECGIFYLRKTRRKSLFCCRKCRAKHFNTRYTQSGKTREWYRKRKTGEAAFATSPDSQRR